MNLSDKIENIITKLYNWCTTYKDQTLLRDMSKQYNTKFDAYIESTVSSPLSFTIFELSEKGELIIDKQQRILESQAAFFLFVNPRTGWIFAIKNTVENQKKLLTGEAIQNFKIKTVI